MADMVSQIGMGREEIVVYSRKSGSLLCCSVYRFVTGDANVTKNPDENDLCACMG